MASSMNDWFSMVRTFLIILLVLVSGVLGVMAGKKAFVRKLQPPFSSALLTPSTPLIPSTLEKEPLPSYPWEKDGQISPITKDYFRCKGSTLNPPIPILKDQKVVENIFDCSGSHSLPIRHGKEFIMPILIELLNEIQASTGKAVVITSGHRCPQHNRYVDTSPKNLSSKHQIGAEVSFYVAGLEHHPDTVLNAIFSFYRADPRYSSEGKCYTVFERYEKETDVSTKPWFNKEILIKQYLPREGRNNDNRHPFPYFSIQVRFDRETNMRCSYTSEEAQCFQRK
jgi:hypothetical protein